MQNLSLYEEAYLKQGYNLHARDSEPQIKTCEIHGQTSLDVEITILYFLTVYKIAEEFLLPSNMYMMVVDLLYLALSLKTAL